MVDKYGSVDEKIFCSIFQRIKFQCANKKPENNRDEINYFELS